MTNARAMISVLDMEKRRGGHVTLRHSVNWTLGGVRRAEAMVTPTPGRAFARGAREGFLLVASGL